MVNAVNHRDKTPDWMQSDNQEERQEEGKATKLAKENQEENKAIVTTVEKQDEQSVTTTTTKTTIKTISEQKNEPSIINIDTTTEATKQNLDTLQPKAVT